MKHLLPFFFAFFFFISKVFASLVHNRLTLKLPYPFEEMKTSNGSFQGIFYASPQFKQNDKDLAYFVKATKIDNINGTPTSQDTLALVDGLRTLSSSKYSDFSLNFYSRRLYALKPLSVNFTSLTVVSNLSSPQIHTIKEKNIEKAVYNIGPWALFEDKQNKLFMFGDKDKKEFEFHEIEEDDREGCLKLAQDKCAHIGDSLVYCILGEGADAHLSHFKMPSCKPETSGAKLDLKNLEIKEGIYSISSEGDILAICSNEDTTKLETSCSLFDTKNSLFSGSSGSKSTPLRTLNFIPTSSPSDPFTVSSIKFSLTIGCVFFNIEFTSSSKYNSYYACLSQPTNPQIAPANTDIPLLLKYNFEERLFAYQSQASPSKEIIAFRLDQLNSEAISPSYCRKYNQELNMCTVCQSGSQLRTTGDCSEPRKKYLKKSMFDVSFNSHILTVKFKIEDNAFKTFWERIKATGDLSSFLHLSEKTEIAKMYNMIVFQTDDQILEFKTIRVQFLPKDDKSQDKIKTKVDILMRPNPNQQSGTSRLLQEDSFSVEEPLSDAPEINISAYYFLSLGRLSFYRVILDHIYTIAFFVQVYLILIRPFLPRMLKSDKQHWLAHFVLSIQTLYILGFNAWDLKGAFNGFFIRAGQSSFRYLGWNPREEPFSADQQYEDNFYLGKYTMAQQNPVFIRELTVFTILYCVTFLGGMLSPFFRNQLRASRSALLICHLPKIGFIYFMGVYDIFFGKNTELKDYVSFILSSVLIIVAIVDLSWAIFPRLRTRLDSLFGFPHSSPAYMHDIEDYEEVQAQIPFFMHFEILTAFLIGAVVALTYQHGLLQGLLLIGLVTVRFPGLFYFFKVETSNSVHRYKLIFNFLLLGFLVLMTIFHKSNPGKKSTVILTVFSILLFFIMTLICLLELISRLSKVAISVNNKNKSELSILDESKSVLKGLDEKTNNILNNSNLQDNKLQKIEPSSESNQRKEEIGVRENLDNMLNDPQKKDIEIIKNQDYSQISDVHYKILNAPE